MHGENVSQCPVERVTKQRREDELVMDSPDHDAKAHQGGQVANGEAVVFCGAFR